VRSVSRVVAGVENCCIVAMDPSVSARGTGTEVGWPDFVDVDES
jgi:hypothetical protein